MIIKNKILEEIFILFGMTLKNRAELSKIIIVTCIVAFFELLSVGFLIPFLKILSSPADILEEWNFFKDLNIKTTDELIKLCVLFFLLIIISSGLFRFLLMLKIMKLTFSIGLLMSTKIFSNVINQKYEYHLVNNSSTLIDAISTKTNNVVYLAVMPFINLVSSLIILSAFLIVLLFIFPLITINILLLVGVAYYLSIRINSKRIARISHKLAHDAENSVKITQETLGNIKEIIINDYKKYAIDIFYKNEASLKKIQGEHSVITLSPKILIELLGFLLIVLFAFYYSTENSVLTLMPTLAGLAFTFQKLLPLMQQAYASWTSLKGAEGTVQEINSLLNLPIETAAQNIKSINFERKIFLKKISYKYSNGYKIFDDFSLEIKKNEKICIYGESGKGKSTLINLIMGLINPQSGEVFVDDNVINSKNIVSWQKKIAHVPQNIFIADESVLNNITLGVAGPVDLIKVRELINFVELNEYIRSLAKGIDSNLGEDGAKMSGGQRQKIGIARALYKNTDILILDESTNSLDPQSEENILYKLSLLRDKTIILITHKYENHKYFGNVINIANMKEI